MPSFLPGDDLAGYVDAIQHPGYDARAPPRRPTTVYDGREMSAVPLQTTVPSRLPTVEATQRRLGLNVDDDITTMRGVPLPGPYRRAASPLQAAPSRQATVEAPQALPSRQPTAGSFGQSPDDAAQVQAVLMGGENLPVGAPSRMTSDAFSMQQQVPPSRMTSDAASMQQQVPPTEFSHEDTLAAMTAWGEERQPAQPVRRPTNPVPGDAPAPIAMPG